MSKVRVRVSAVLPEGAGVVSLPDGFKGPFITGNGDTTYACGQCNRVLLKDVSLGQFQNMVIHCPSCGDYAEIPSAGFRFQTMY